jgi:hypothetical protein
MKDLPHVTSILRPYMNLDWVKQEHLERGQRRHQSYASHLLGTWAPPLPPEDQGALDSFRRLKTWFIEQPLVDEDLGYAGTIDFGGELTICPGVVIDWKPPSGKGPITRAQVISYLKLVQKNKWPVKMGAILRIDPQGGIATLEWVMENDVAWTGFLSALNAHRYFNAK